ncbi:Protein DETOXIFICATION 17 [Glycine max]|uniref:Protein DETOXIFICATION 17 n=1 Tax=Glycine soja TaxID=3848 RepID=A0A445KT53_GLYSO|nr:Protein DETOXIFICATION 17 [Glycine max]RZC14107.1 Protein DETOXIFICATION 17 [Glycine soja]
MRIVREEVVEEVKRLWLAVPLFSVGILLHILQAISIMFVGHLGTLPLSVGVSYCTGHILWSIKWSRTVPYAWHTHAEIHACCFNDMIPSLFAYGILRCILKFLQTQKIVFPMVLTSGIAAVLHVLFCWLLVFKSGLANRGAALANSISYWVNAILISLYVRFSSACKHSWTGFSKMALHNLLDFLKLGAPSAAMHW